MTYKQNLRFGSVCSGIEAASVAWGPLGWEAAWLSEIEPFPCAVLKHHYPDVPNYGDMTLLPERILSGEVEAPDIFCGGTPCQAFSVAGLRNSLDDARGNLSLTFVGIANAIDHVRSVRRDDPAIIFWENVPGVLNTKDNAFGCFLGALAGENDPIVPPGDKWTNAGCVYGPQRTVAWRVLDAQYFGVAQRRRRVFVIASSRDDFDPAKVLFEFEGVRRDTAPRREEGQRPTARSEDSTRGSSEGLLGGGDCGVELSGPLSARDYKDAGTDGMNKTSAKMVPVVQDLVGALDTECGGNKMSHQTIASGHLLPVKSFYESSLAQYREDNVSGTIKASGGVAGGGSETFLAQPMAFVQNSRDEVRLMGGDGSHVGSLTAEPGAKQQCYIAQPVAYSFDSLSSNSMKSSNPHSGCNPVDVSRSLDTSRGLDPTCNQGGIGIAQPIAVYENHPADSRVKEMGEVCSTVTSRWGTGGGNMPIVSQPIPIHSQAMNHNGKNHDEARGRGNGLGIGQEGDPMNTLTRADRHAVAQPIAFHPTQDPISSSDGTTHGLGCGSSGGQASIAVAHEMTIPIDSMNHLGRNNDAHSMGDFVPGAPSYTLTKGHSHAVAHPIVLMDQGGSVMNVQTDGTTGTLRRETHGHEPVVMQPIAVDIDNTNLTGDLAGNLCAEAQSRTNKGMGVMVSPTLTASNDPSRSPQSSEVTNQVAAVHSVSMAVRRLTPTECERLQGFPDDYTNIPWRKAEQSPDGPRYKALGNSWAVPVVAWIGQRIQANLKENNP